MPGDSFEELLTPLNEIDLSASAADKKQAVYDDKNVQAIVSLLEFLDKRLDKVSKAANTNIRSFCIQYHE